MAFSLGLTLTLAARAAKPPSAAELASYNAVQQAVIDALNTYRASKGAPAVTSLPVLAKAARLSAEDDLFAGASGPDVFTRATSLGYQGAFGGVVLGHGYITPERFIAGITTSGDTGILDTLKDPDSKYLGVGVALNAAGTQTDTQWYLLFGKDGTSPPPPYGTAGIETDSGRGLPDLSQYVAIYAGSVLGNSIDGFTYGDLPDANTIAVTKIVKKLLKKPLQAKARAGGSVGAKLPSVLVRTAKIKVKGKLPAGVKFKKGALSGKPTTPGKYTIRLQVTLPFAIDGKSTVILKVGLTVNEG